MHTEAQHFNHLVEDSRTPSLAEANELAMHRQPIAPAAPLEHVASGFPRQAAEGGVPLSVAGAPGVADAVVDPERMAQRAREGAGGRPAGSEAAIRSAYYAPNREVPERVAGDALARYRDRFPSAIHAIEIDLKACWAHLRCGVVHHERIRTTNLARQPGSALVHAQDPPHLSVDITPLPGNRGKVRRWPC